MFNVDVQLGDYANYLHTEVSSNIALKLAAVFEQLVALTPVDSGRARASWSIVPSGMSAPVLAPGSYPEPVLPSFRNIYHSEDNFNIVNTAPYIYYLNEGSSKQAPSRFVETAISIGMNLR